MREFKAVKNFKSLNLILMKMKAKSIIKNYTPDLIIRIYLWYKKRKERKIYAGDNVECPICNSKFAIFATFGMNNRVNARCINCGSLERTRLLWKYFCEKTNLFNSDKKSKLLHFAPEKVFYNIFSKNKSIEYVPCDLSPGKYSHYGGGTKITKADITNIPFEDNCFDIVLCNHVLEHIPDDKQAMKELYRVMKQGGWGIFQVPIEYERELTFEDPSITSDKERERVFGQYDHVRIYGNDYKFRLQEIGFRVLEDDYVKQFSAEQIFKYGISDSELIYFCQK